MKIQNYQRSLLAAVLSCIAAAAVAGGNTLTINSFGGAYEAAHRKCVIAPFEKETGANVNVVTAYSADALAQLRAQKNAPQFDIVNFSGGQEVVAAREKLLTPIDPANLSNAPDLYDFAKGGLAKGEGPVYSVAAIGMIYNSKTMAASPTSWKEVFDPKLSQHLVLADITNGYGMLSFLMLNKISGGDLHNIQPGLVAVKKLLGEGATIVSTSPEIQQAFAQDGAVLSPYASDYAYTLAKAGLPTKFALGQEGTPAVYITTNLVAGRPNQKRALKFIDMSLSRSSQTCFANELRYSPTNTKVTLSPDVAAGVAYGHAGVKSLFRFDADVIEANRVAWVDQWNKAIAR